ncbi:MAG: hypothetical protein ACJAXW_002435 [Candidatus Azotimanducaceae bacterium]|jgi:hypothetical protein
MTKAALMAFLLTARLPFVIAYFFCAACRISARNDRRDDRDILVGLFIWFKY